MINTVNILNPVNTVNTEPFATKILHTEIKQQLLSVVDALSLEKAQQLLEFAAFLRQRSEVVTQPTQENVDEWEMATRCAETYWFSLPESTRQSYAGKVVAIAKDQIIDSDPELRSLKRRMRDQFPEQPILYIEADATQLPPLVVRSPRLR